MDTETTQEMRQGEWSGEAPSLESLRELHMTALLNDVVGELGQVKAAERLGIDRKTLWRCMTTGKRTPRLSDALERLLLSRDLSAAMRQGKRVEVVVDRVSALEEKLRSGLEAVVGEVKAMREEHARAMRHVERRLVRLEAARNGTEGASPEGAGTEPSKRRYVPGRTYPQLVTEEAEPDEDMVYGDAAPVVVEWRRARDEFHKALKTGTALDRTEVQERMLELEVAIVEEHGLTLPPATFPWDEFDRRDQLWERQQDLMRVRVKRNRALLRRWLRRVLTFRLWRD